MKHRKSAKVLALGLVFTLGLGLSAAFAAQSVAPATTKVTVDGTPVAVDAYNIDNGNNYFKLRDFAANLDFGLTYDAAADTAHIDTTAHYKPDPKQLITGNWAPRPGPGCRPSSTPTPERAGTWSSTSTTPPWSSTWKRPC